MNSNEAKSKFALDRIMFLGLLVLGVLVAQVLVNVKANVDLSRPIRIDSVGLSVSVPEGKGWRYDDAWVHVGDVFVLDCAFVSPRGRASINVRCKLRLAKETGNIRDHFANIAVRVDGKILDSGEIQFGERLVHWTWITDRRGWINTLYGTMDLPYNRQLDIEVHETMGDMEWANNIFKRVLSSVVLEEDPRWKVGIDLVKSVKEKGLGSFLDNQNLQNLYLINDAQDKRLGFSMDVVVDLGDEEEMPIQAAGVLYLKDEDVRDIATTFYSTKDLSSFRWQSRTVVVSERRRGSRGSRVVFDESGVMTVTRDEVDERKLLPGPMAVPNTVMELLFIQMLASGLDECLLDIIEDDGRIIPTLVRRIAKVKMPSDEVIRYGLALEFLDGRDTSEEVYFDKDMRIVREIYRNPEYYLLERASGSEVAREFPERADLVLRDILGEKLEQDK